MTSSLKQLEEKLKIDEHALEIALRDNPALFYDVASELALAISQRDEAKQDLDELEAEVDMELRQAASVSGERTTEKEIESNKKADKRVKAATDRFLQLRYDAAKWTALKDAYEQRSYALSKLVELYISNYYSSQDHKPASTTLRDTRAEHVKQSRAKRVYAE